MDVTHSPMCRRSSSQQSRMEQQQQQVPATEPWQEVTIGHQSALSVCCVCTCGIHRNVSAYGYSLASSSLALLKRQQIYKAITLQTLPQERGESTIASDDWADDEVAV